jgi:prepilin-type N-terminal cleavage/methylation domain-containing protein
MRANMFAGLRRCRITGFTFIELLMVVTIISILAAIALPAYRDYELRAQTAEGLLFLGDAKGSVTEFYARWGRMPADNAEAGLRAPDVLRGRYVRRLAVSGGVIVAALELGRDPGTSQALQRTLTFRPWVNAANPGAPLIWTCNDNVPEHAADYRPAGEVAADPVDARWLPTTCRH